ncbi:MAG: LysR family transcriptional regulator [Desulfobacterales bacterium]|nr:LysR family transcriptional regulator [Desulfobacterales bacterium]
MNIDHLRSFFMVAKVGNFTKAARELFLTQPAVSQHIQALEHFYNTVLFDRTGRKIMLTRQGEMLFEQTEALLDQFKEIETLFQGLNSMSRGRLDIATSAVVGTYMLPKIVGRYNAAYPDIEMELKAGNTHQVTNLVLEGQVDFGFAAGPASQYPELETDIIHVEKMVAVTAPENPLAKLETVHLEDFGRTPFISREQGTQTRQFVRNWLARSTAGDKPQIKFIELENVETVKRVVEEGFGISVIPESAVQREIETGHLVPVNLDGFDEESTFYLLRHKGRKLSIAAKTFLSMLPGVFTLAEHLELELPAR